MSAGLLGSKVGVILAGSFAAAGTVFALSAYLYTGAGTSQDSGAAGPATGRTTPARMQSIEALPRAEVIVDWDRFSVVRAGFEPITLTASEDAERVVLPARHRGAGARARPVAPLLLTSRAGSPGFRRDVIRPGPAEGIPEWGTVDRVSEAVAADEADPVPERPGRADVSRAMASIRRGVQRCFDLKMVPGEVVVHLTVAGRTGRVTHSRTSESTGTAVCIEQLARRLRFPRFARERVTIRYTYDLR